MCNIINSAATIDRKTSTRTATNTVDLFARALHALAVKPRNGYDTGHGAQFAGYKAACTSC